MDWWRLDGCVTAFPSPPRPANWNCIYSSELAPALSLPSLPIKEIGCEHLTLSIHLGVKWFEKKTNHHCHGFVSTGFSGGVSLKCQTLNFSFFFRAHASAFDEGGGAFTGFYWGNAGQRGCTMSSHFDRANVVYNCLSLFFPPRPRRCWFKWGKRWNYRRRRRRVDLVRLSIEDIFHHKRFLGEVCPLPLIPSLSLLPECVNQVDPAQGVEWNRCHYACLCRLANYRHHLGALIAINPPL